MRLKSRKKKRLVVLGIIIAGMLFLAGVAVKYLPINKILRIRSNSGSYLDKVRIDPETGPCSLYFDFEEIPGEKIPSAFYKGLAHSGNYCTKAFGKNSYSAAIERTFTETGIREVSTVGWSAWVYVFPTNKEINAALVFAISTKPGVNLIWKSINLSGPAIPTGKWFKISTSADISDVKIDPGYTFQLYFWNKSSTDILIDDYFIVFNGPEKSRGGPVQTDMTMDTKYSRGFNLPPFPSKYLQSAETRESDHLRLNDGTFQGILKIDPEDMIIAGKFVKSRSGVDDIFVIRKDKSAEMFTFCPETNRFIGRTVDPPQGISPFGSAVEIYKARFSGNLNEQLLLKTGKELVLGSFSKISDPCGSKLAQPIKFEITWRSPVTVVNRGNTGTGSVILIGDFDGDHIHELILTGDDGAWQMFRMYSGSTLSVQQIASGDLKKIWNSEKMKFSVSSGKFLPILKQDILLVVFKESVNGKQSYALLKFDPKKKEFESPFPGTKMPRGKAIGFDTLHLTDKFFTGYFENKERSQVLRYDRSWRFDLKEIEFSDSAFEILFNIDFKGFRKEFNPKYYENLRIVTGCFLEPGLTSLLIIGSNPESMSKGNGPGNQMNRMAEFPSFVSVYSFGERSKTK